MYPKIKTLYGVKLVKNTYPILSGASFVPTDEDVRNALDEGFMQGADTVTNYLKYSYMESKSNHEGEEISADELLNRVYNRSNIKEKGPEVESYHSYTATTPERIRKKYTHVSPELKRKKGTVETVASSPIKPL